MATQKTAPICCQSCGVEAPVKYVEFYQNIGMLFMRRMASIKGYLCKNCIHKNFWKMTMTTIAVGWLGTISIIISPFLVLNNIFRYLSAIPLGAVPAGATSPRIDDATVHKVLPFMPTIVKQTNAGVPLAELAKQIAPQAGVTPAQVMMSVSAIAKWQREQAGRASLAQPQEVIPLEEIATQAAIPLEPEAPGRSQLGPAV